MKEQSQAQIYKSELRGLLISDGDNCLSTFNFGTYYDDFRKPFGLLHVLNEEILLPQHCSKTSIETDTEIIILPLFGGVEYKDSLGNEDFIRVEQIRSFSAEKGMSFELFNPYGVENVSYLQIWIKSGKQDSKTGFKQFDFDLNQKNQLISLFKTANSFGFIGNYEGRIEGLYQLKNKSNGVFIFVISGAFEIDNRLLESRDGLHLLKTDFFEWEALSENALFLLLEIPLDKELIYE
ncbi:pirin family protein [Flavobacterium sp. WC2421]|uniref:pirin family protein n=1 Tax=Flavobacterium sp. WC2421 TaxID=3234138 RepID=UPI0034675E6A